MKKILLFALLITSLSFQTKATWTQTNGPAGGDVNCLYSVGTNVFAGTPNGVYLSTNSGASWAAKNSGLNTNLNPTIVESIVAIGSTVFIGTSDGVFSSTNNGNTWLDANGGIGVSLPFFNHVYGMAVKGTDLFVGLNSGGIYKSSNNGSTWASVNTGFPINKKVNSIVVMGSNLFAATEGAGIYISTNNGTSWSAVLDPSVATSFIRALHVSGTTLFAAEYGTGGLLVSTNNGASFTVNTNGFSQNAAVRSFTMNGSTIYAGTVSNGIFKSTNNGASWTASTTGIITSQICGIYALTLVGSDLLAGSQGCGVFKSTNNGTSWAESNTSLNNTTVHAIAFGGTNLYAGIDGVGIFKSTNEGASWTNATVGTSIYNVRTLKASGPVIYAGGDGGGYKSINNGATWTDLGSCDPNSIYPPAIYGFATDATYLYAATSDGVFISANAGATWTASSSGLPSFQKIACIAISGINIYVGTDDGIYKSTNSGATWSQSYQSFIPVNSIVVNGTNVYGAMDLAAGVVVSANNGLTWTITNSGFASGTEVKCLAAVGSNIFAGTTDGVYRTSNGGTTWTSISAGFPLGTVVNSIANNSDSLFAGTNSAVWKDGLNLGTQICIVTVDDLSQNNVIIWEKPVVTNIAKYIIYREDVSNVYIPIDSVPYNQLSQYIDVSSNGNPNLASRRYKIREVDINGVRGSFSAYHNTILLQENAGNFNWNIYEVEGQSPGYPVVQNKLYRDDNSTGVWNLITTTAGTQTGFTDPDYGLYPNSRYRIEGDLGGLTCTPTVRTAAGVNNSKSNIKNKAIGVEEINEFDSRIVLHPNPANDYVLVSFTIDVKNIQVIDNFGRTIILQDTNANQAGQVSINISKLPSGLYTLMCQGKDFLVRKKLIVK